MSKHTLPLLSPYEKSILHGDHESEVKTYPSHNPQPRITQPSNPPFLSSTTTLTPPTPTIIIFENHHFYNPSTSDHITLTHSITLTRSNPKYEATHAFANKHYTTHSSIPQPTHSTDSAPASTPRSPCTTPSPTSSPSRSHARTPTPAPPESQAPYACSHSHARHTPCTSPATASPPPRSPPPADTNPTAGTSHRPASAG